MGNILCCDRARKAIKAPRIVCLLDNSGDVIREFDHVHVANTPRSRNIAFHNHVPEPNECLLLPSSSLPNRLRTVNTKRICSEITVLFCCSDKSKSAFTVQEQHQLGRNNSSITPKEDGDLIVQCGPISLPISQVKVID
jgi:hypothetical protein